MHKSKRQRSLEILKEVTELFRTAKGSTQEHIPTIAAQEVIDAGILEPAQTDDWKITKIPDDLKIERVWTENNAVMPAPYITEFAPYNELDYLRWHAAVVTHDCGKFVTVEPAEMTAHGVPVPNVYSIRTAKGTMGAYPFNEAWSYLTGFENGVEEVTGESYRLPREWKKSVGY